MAVRNHTFLTILGVGAIVFGVVSGLSLHQTSADPLDPKAQQAQQRPTQGPSTQSTSEAGRLDEVLPTKPNVTKEQLYVPATLQAPVTQPRVGIQALQPIAFEDFNDPAWPLNSPGWGTFQARRTDNITPQCGGKDCDVYWGGGYTPGFGDPGCPNSTITDPRMQGRTYAWPALAGADAYSPNCNYYPTYLDSWMVYGPVNVQDAKALTLTFQTMYTITESANTPGQPIKEGLAMYFFPDETGDGYGISLRQNGYFNDSIELFSTLQSFGISRPRSTYIVLRFVSDSEIDFADGAFIDFLQITKEIDPAQSNIRGMLFPGTSVGTDLAPGGGLSNDPGKITNGGFDQGLSGWTVNSQAPSLPTLTAIAGNQSIGVNGSRAAVLGDQAIKCVSNGSPPRDGNSILEQVFQVPSSGNPRLRFQYRYFTEDYTKDKQSDSFDVRLRTTGGVTDGDLAFRKELTKAEVDAMTQQQKGDFPGLDSRACDNTATRKSYVEPTAGFKEVTLPLDAYRGKTTTISFQVWNRIDTQFNTYVILDSVEILP